ncbi:acyl-CoA dehydrogenase family protein, partial [Pseudomonas aeruginosa]
MTTMIPRTLLSSDHELVLDSVRKFLEQEAVPFHHQLEKDGHVDRALWNQAGEVGMLCSHLPEEYGGMGAVFLYRA